MTRTQSFRLSLLAAGFLAVLGATSVARAEEEFDLTVSKGHLVLKTKGKWHINKDYPWRFTQGEKKIGREAFQLSEESASVDLPQGGGKLRGGVCNGDQCLRIEKDVTIP